MNSLTHRHPLEAENPGMRDSPTRLLDFIDASPWRKALTAAQVERVRADTTMRSFPAGATVCLRGSPALHWLAVIDGMLKVETVAEDGRGTTFAGVPGGAWFGEGAALKAEPRPYAVARRQLS